MREILRRLQIASIARAWDFVKDPDLIATPKFAALTAGWFWSTHNLNTPADALDHARVTKIINGGQIGLEDRIKHTQQALMVLA